MNGTAIETVGSMDEQSVQELPGGGKITYANMDSTMAGDIIGTCQSTMIMLYSDNDTAKYHGYQTIDGTIGGKKGTTVFWFEGGFDGQRIVTHFRFLPEFSTGDLVGLKGGGTVTAGKGNIAEYVFEYSFLEK
jgi:hypothetical protein